jgi:hypothetical protein
MTQADIQRGVWAKAEALMTLRGRFSVSSPLSEISGSAPSAECAADML